jgi:hypothetical protein
MPNNSGTVIIGGHGSYNSNYVFDIGAYNYNIVFPCSMKQQMSNIAHNQLICGFYNMGNLPYLNMLEAFPTTYIANRNGPHFAGEYDMSLRYTSLLFQHNISPADNVVNVIDFGQMPGSNYIGALCINNRAWPNNTSISINYDPIKLGQQILANPPQFHNQHRYELLVDDYIFITPSAPQGINFSIPMTSLLNEVLPNIKFPIQYNPANPANNNFPTATSFEPFIDNNLLLQQKIHNYQAYFQNGEIYNEVCIAGDSNIVWDACRDEA